MADALSAPPTEPASRAEAPVDDPPDEPTAVAPSHPASSAPTVPPPRLASDARAPEDADVGLARPPLEITQPMRELPPARGAPAAAPSRERALAWTARIVVGASMALGVGVIVAHVARAGAPPPAPRPLRVVVGSESVPAAAGARPAVAAARVDRRTSVDELQRRAADHLAAGRLERASEVYAALAERAPHERAYAVAARVLAEKAAR